MKNLKTKYMGISIDNPIIVGSSSLTDNPDSIKLAEENGAGAIIYKSLFEEQIQLETFQFEEKLSEFNDIHAEMLTMHPKAEHRGPEEHLNKVRKAKESLSIPLIASLNAVSRSNWIKYAKLLSQTGVDGIELNFYQIPSDYNLESKEVEDEQIEIVREIKQSVKIPVSVKLSYEYTNLLSFIRKMDQDRVNGFVLFNSFFQPDIDIYNETHIKSINLTNYGDYKRSLRYSGLLFGNINGDICSSHGIYTGADVIKFLLTGSSCVQIVSTLFKNGIPYIKNIKQEISDWMEHKNYNSINEFRGKLSKNKLSSNPFVYKRAQYVDLLINSEKIFEGTK